MSTLALIAAAAQATASATPAPPALAEPLHNDVQISIPSLDGAHGLEVGYERWLPAHRLSLTVTGQLRESAIGDYTGIHAGVGFELRWYPRASGWRSAQPYGSMVGWFLGERVDVGLDATHDREAHRWLDNTLEIGAMSRLGYRFAPWRGLEISPSVGIGWRHDTDLEGRIPGWTRPTLSGGLSVGWMY
jgi:hypothetical protein